MPQTLTDQSSTSWPRDQTSSTRMEVERPADTDVRNEALPNQVPWRNEEWADPITLEMAGHDLTIYAESPPLISAMVDAIRLARTRVWLESYIIEDDAAGQAVRQALQEKAREGLDVRVLYDAFGSISTPAAFFDELTEAGAKVHAYHSWADALRGNVLRVLNRRNHRKLLVVDERAAFFGGMNIVDQTRAKDSEEAKANLPASAGWRDVHVRISGPQLSELAESFERSWLLAQRRRIRRRARSYRRVMLPASDESIRFFDSGPGLKHSRSARVFRRLIERADKNIVLSMAYFLPPGRVLGALLRARRRGVDITVIVPGSSDVKLVQFATRHLYSKLLRRGLKIFERQDRMLHSKVMVVDEQWSVVGSCNLDPRSLATNLEFLGVIRSRQFAAAILEICQHEIEHSRPVVLAECQARRWWQRWIDRIAYSFRRWL